MQKSRSRVSVQLLLVKKIPQRLASVVIWNTRRQPPKRTWCSAQVDDGDKNEARSAQTRKFVFSSLNFADSSKRDNYKQK